MRIFTIDSMTVDQPRLSFDEVRVIARYEAQLKAKIEAICPVCLPFVKNVHARWWFIAEGRGDNCDGAVLKTIELLLNKQVYQKFDIPIPPCDHDFDYRAPIRCDFSQWDEPWRSLFDELFKGGMSTYEQLQPGRKFLSV